MFAAATSAALRRAGLNPAQTAGAAVGVIRAKAV
jgi:hypothetical protein